MLASIPAGAEPKNEAKAWGSPDWPLWEEAMAKEVSELAVKHTWELVDAPPGTNIVGSRWTYQLKCNTNGNIIRYKAHLVMQGFTQAAGVDYDATFAPVVRFKSNQVVLAIAVHNDWEIHQIDVKNTYLNAELTKMIYMKQLPGFAPPGSEGQVCRLFKALYGLKQAGRWYHQISEAFSKFLYMWCTSEHCMFYKHINGQTVIVVIAIDDLTLASSCR